MFFQSQKKFFNRTKSIFLENKTNFVEIPYHASATTQIVFFSKNATPLLNQMWC